MIELKILDEVLTKLKDKTDNFPLLFADILWYTNKLCEISDRNRRVIIEKLVEDGYAGADKFPLTESNPMMVDKYFITYNGLIFIKKGGYLKQYENEKIEIKFKNITFYVILIGSILAGMISIIAFLDRFCILKYWFSISNHVV